MNKQIILFVTVIFIGVISLGIVLFLVNRGVGQEQRAVPSKAAESDTSKCQGKGNSPAKCFDCKKDATASSEVNILDFQCFTKFYGQTVGKP